MPDRYAVDVLPGAVRELVKLRREWLGRVVAAIEALADEPRPDGSKLLSGTGRERIWRIRVGQYRVLYQVADSRVTVLIVRVADRREVYNRAAIQRLLGGSAMRDSQPVSPAPVESSRRTRPASSMYRSDVARIPWSPSLTEIAVRNLVSVHRTEPRTTSVGGRSCTCSPDAVSS